MVQGLLELSKKYPIIDIRGRGLMVAVEFGEQRSVDGSFTAKAGCAAAVTKAAQKRNMILLTAGEIPDTPTLWTLRATVCLGGCCCTHAVLRLCQPVSAQRHVVNHVSMCWLACGLRACGVVKDMLA